MDDDLRARRLSCGLTQEGVSRLAECSTAMVRLLESGYRPDGESAVLARVEGVLAAHTPAVSPTKSGADDGVGTRKAA